jgi:purine-binding chemotaxis protein CheW
VFRLGEERYGLPIESVERILPDQTVTKIPRAPKMVLGVFELRGVTLPAIDARARFDLEPCAESKNMVVVLSDAGRCAFRVDSVDGIFTFDESEIDEAGVSIGGKADAFLNGIGKKDGRLTVLLDPEKLVPEQVQKKIAAA